jgi:ribosomal protein S18 acetylase RimI-like enzyme
VPGDVPLLGPVWLETYETLTQVDARIRLSPQGQSEWQAWLLERLAIPETMAYTAVRRGQVAGAILGSITSHRPGLLPPLIGQVDELIIDAHGHGGGPGRLLWEAALAYFKARGITRVQCEAPSQGPIAQAFWRAMGATRWYDLFWVKLGD